MITRTLVKFIEATTFDDLPQKVVHKAKMCILDSLGCALSGSKTVIGEKLVNLTSYLGGKRQSTIFGTKEMTSCDLAAFVNSELVNALDFDDTLVGHPGATIIPPAIAVGEITGCTGKELITAIVLGYECDTRIGSALITEEPRKCLGMPWQVFGAVTSAGKILNLNEDDMNMAMGIAGSAAPIPSDLKCSLNPLNKQLGMGMVKNNFGYMAETGARAALLAKMGYTGPYDILEGETGFWRMAGFDGCRFDEITAKLGERYRILDVAFKPYSCCRYFHAAIDAALNIVKKNNLRLNKIETIIVKVLPSLAVPPMDDPTPKTLGSAIGSIPYSISIALHEVRSGPEWFTAESLNNPDILALAKKVKLIGDPEAAKYKGLYAEVEIRSKEKKYRDVVICPKGEPENPMTDEEMKDKFADLASPVIGNQKAMKVINVIRAHDNLENIENISSLTKLLNCRIEVI